MDFLLLGVQQQYLKRNNKDEYRIRKEIRGYPHETQYTESADSRLHLHSIKNGFRSFIINHDRFSSELIEIGNPRYPSEGDYSHEGDEYRIMVCEGVITLYNNHATILHQKY